METMLKKPGRPKSSKRERIERQNRKMAEIPFAAMLDTFQTSIYISMSVAWLKKGRMTKRNKAEPNKRFIPCPTHIQLANGRIRYKKTMLDQWIEEYGTIAGGTIVDDEAEYDDDN